MKTIFIAFALFASQAFAASVTVNNPSCANYTYSTLNGDVTLTCGSTTPPGTPECTIMPNPTTPVAPGSIVQLGSSCSPPATSFAWTGVNSTAAAATVYPTATTTYTLRGSNQYGAGNTASATIQVIAPPPPPPPPPPVTCDTSKTRAQVNSTMQTMQQTPAVAYVFIASSAGQAKLEYPTATYTLTISTQPCDFEPARDPSNVCRTFGSSPNPVIFYSSYYPGLCRLTEGAQYYFNVRPGLPVGATGWTTGDCDVTGICAFMPF